MPNSSSLIAINACYSLTETQRTDGAERNLQHVAAASCDYHWVCVPQGSIFMAVWAATFPQCQCPSPLVPFTTGLCSLDASRMLNIGSDSASSTYLHLFLSPTLHPILQTYIINQAKVMFLNQRPQSKIGRPGAPDSCQTCARTLREGCSYCSLACKVEALEAIGKLRMPAAGNCADATLSDSESEGWPIQPRSYQKLYEQEVNSLALQVQDGVSGDSSSSQQLWGEHRQHVHVGATAAWLRRNSDDSTSSGSHYSRRKQFSPRRSPLL